MADETQPTSNVWTKTAMFASQAISFDRLLVVGLLVVLGVVMLLAAVLALRFGTENKEVVLFVGEMYKNVALTLMGALANSVSHKSNSV